MIVAISFDMDSATGFEGFLFDPGMTTRYSGLS